MDALFLRNIKNVLSSKNSRRGSQLSLNNPFRKRAKWRLKVIDLLKNRNLKEVERYGSFNKVTSDSVSAFQSFPDILCTPCIIWVVILSHLLLIYQKILKICLGFVFDEILVCWLIFEKGLYMGWSILKRNCASVESAPLDHNL